MTEKCLRTDAEELANINQETERKIRMKAKYIENDHFTFENIDYNHTYEIPADRPVRIYCDGVYDLFHYGHVRSLKQAKNLFPNVYLICGIHNDKDVEYYKSKTVMNEKERYESVSNCKYVDQIIEGSPWFSTKEYLHKHRIDYLCHDGVPYPSEETEDVYAVAKALNKFIPIKRTLEISTSDIISRILLDLDFYKKRQQKRGFPDGESRNEIIKK
jgi:cytidyltransferase-like protein